MPRHRRRSTSSVAVAAVAATSPCGVDLAQVQVHLEALERAVEGTSLTGQQRVALRTRWNRAVPDLSLALAGAMEGAPALFQHAGVDAPALRAGEQRVRQLVALKAMFDRIADQIADALLLEKSTLYDQVQQALQAVRAALQAPMVSPLERERLRCLAGPALSIVAARQADIRRRRQVSAALRQAARGPCAQAAGSALSIGPAGPTSRLKGAADAHPLSPIHPAEPYRPDPLAQHDRSARCGTDNNPEEDPSGGPHQGHDPPAGNARGGQEPRAPRGRGHFLPA